MKSPRLGEAGCAGAARPLKYWGWARLPTVTTFDALISGISWNGVGVAGRPVFVTYSFDATFASAFTSSFSSAFLSSFQAFTPADQDVARQALSAWADVSGLTLIEVPAGMGDIRFGVYDFRFGPENIQDSAAFAYNPYVLNLPDGAWEEDFGGDVFVDIGQVNFDILVHEIGHALGLKHPFEGDPTLETAIDDLVHTVMTYNPVGGPATALGSLDVLAIQHLYGQHTADGTQAQNWSWDAPSLTLTQAGGAGDDTLAGVAVNDRIRAGAGSDYVMTRAGSDRLDGEEGADTMAGGAGDDTLNGGAGNDILDGDNDNDTMVGGAGDDELWGMAGSDTLDGGEGDDYVSGGAGVNRLFGGAGSDTLTLSSGTSFVDGGEGYDELWYFAAGSGVTNYANLTAGGGTYANIEAIALYGGQGVDTMVGGDLIDFLMGYAGADSLSGGGGGDELYGDTGSDTLSGGDSSDLLDGSAGDDVILPGEGADEIWGGSGIDTVDYSGELSGIEVTINGARATAGQTETMNGVENLVGSAFADNLTGDASDNRLFGGGGNDTVRGGDGANYLRGDDGADSLGGGIGFDDINGNVGDDTASGGAGDDWVVGGKDRDLLFGDDGNDLVYGNLGADTCEGGSGNDTLRGGQQDDMLLGGAGDDFLSGDRDNDTLTGGAGADVFHTFAEAGVDRVTDFSASQGDRVMLVAGTQYTLAQVGADTVISMTGGGQLILVGVQMNTLTTGWIFGA